MITPLPAPYESHGTAVRWAWWTPRWQCYLPGTKPTVVFDQNPNYPCTEPSPTRTTARLSLFAETGPTTLATVQAIGPGFCND